MEPGDFGELELGCCSIVVAGAVVVDGVEKLYYACYLKSVYLKTC